MIWLKLHNLYDVPFMVNMALVENIESDGAGHTELYYTDEKTRQAKESFEEVENMLHIALIGFKGIVSKEDIGAVVR